MSWISDLAGKAETLLNKIDSETASALVTSSGQRKLISDDKNSSIPNSCSLPANLSSLTHDRSMSLATSRSESNSRSDSISNSLAGSPRKKERSKVAIDYSFVEFDDDDESTVKDVTDMQQLESRQMDDVHSRNSSLSSASSFYAIGKSETPGFTTLDVESLSGGSISTESPPSMEHSISDIDFNGKDGQNGNESEMQKGSDEEQTVKENLMLRKEITSLNQEMSQLLKRTKEANKESKQTRDQLSTLSLQQTQSEALLRSMQESENGLQESVKSKDKAINSLEERLVDAKTSLEVKIAENKRLSSQYNGLLEGTSENESVYSDTLNELQKRLRESEENRTRDSEMQLKLREELESRVSALQIDQNSLSIEVLEMTRKYQEEKDKLSSIFSQNSLLKSELSSSRGELSDYKSKASRILQAKEKLIAQLKDGERGAVMGEQEVLLNEEIEQIRSERELLRDDLERLSEHNNRLNLQLKDAEDQHNVENEKHFSKISSLQEDLRREQANSQVYLNEMKQQKEEFQALQEELTRQKISISLRLDERNVEVNKLQKQIAHKQSSSSSVKELEDCIKGLTESLIHKQTALEGSKSETHTLQIQYERLKNQYDEAQKVLNKDHHTMEIHSEEAARNRMPAFFSESPFDGRVTRRVKKAYGCLDSFSIRLGVFLRRNPICRIFVIFYMFILHMWVMIVLLTYKPEVHGAEYTEHSS